MTPRLFKYRSIASDLEMQRLKEMIREKRLYAATIDSLNDPMEGLIRYWSNKKKGFRYGGKAVKESGARILSLSGTWQCASLWSHYADSHRGVVIEVVPDIKHIVRKVSYVKALPPIAGKSDKEKIILRLTRKYLSWQYEEEYRILTSRTESWVPCTITDVTLGVRASNKQYYELQDEIAKIDPTIKVTKIRFGQLR